MILKNIASMSGVNIAKAITQFAINMMIAYFVKPADFGLVTFSIPFIAFIAMLTDLGLSSAIVRKPTLSAQEAGAAFTLTVTVGAALALLLVAAGLPLEHSLRMHGLAKIMAGLALSVVLSIAAIAPRALLERSLRYQLISSVEAGALLVAAVLCVVSAISGAGVWALVIYQVTIQAARALAFALLARGDLTVSFRWRQIKPMLSFGGWVLASNVLNFAARNSDNIIIGAWIGSAAVGLYGLAYQFMIVPLMVVSWPASGILMATLSRMQTATTKSRASVVTGIVSLTSAFSFPAMGYLTFAMAWPVHALMKPSWAAVVPLIATLAPVGALQSIAVYNGPVLLSNGKARLQFIVGLVNSLTLLATFFIAIPFGLNVLIVAYACVASSLSVAMIVIICWQSQISLRSFALSIAPGALAVTAGLIVAHAIQMFAGQGWGSWLLESAAYGLVIVAIYVFHRKRLLGAAKMLTA
jgi:O-antigen/teichoic acid export membrane protein